MLVLSLVFIFSVVALHSTLRSDSSIGGVDTKLTSGLRSHCEDHPAILELDDDCDGGGRQAGPAADARGSDEKVVKANGRWLMDDLASATAWYMGRDDVRHGMGLSSTLGLGIRHRCTVLSSAWKSKSRNVVA